MDNMTAMVSCFSRAYHYKNNSEWVFKDAIAGSILSEEEYNAIAYNMTKGISYFAPNFKGTNEEVLRFIVDHQLSPSVLVRSAFSENALDNAILLGCKQYAVFASGYDTYSLRTNCSNLRMFELDLPEMITDKRNRIRRNGLKEQCQANYIPCDLSQKTWQKLLIDSGFDKEKIAFGSLLGISYYLRKEEFAALLGVISEIWGEGSSICFDYPTYEEGVESVKSQEMAQAAGEQMKAKYSYAEMEKMLADYGFLIYEHHDKNSATEQFFRKYNEKTPDHVMSAPKGVNYCLAVRKG